MKEVVTTTDQLLIEGKYTKNRQHIADKFNEYFTNIGPQLDVICNTNVINYICIG